MLFYSCIASDELPTVQRQGLQVPEDESVHLFTTLDAAQKACGDDDMILVVDGSALHGVTIVPDRDEVRAPVVPPDALENVDPHVVPRPVTAGGGYVMRRGESGPEIVLIFRRGVWDLPKGKKDDDETIEECALREVREELGVRALQLVRPLGTTTHGYRRDGTYHVKTTHWFLMETPARSFHPDADEDIEEVAWMTWPRALRTIGYRSLREHMYEVEPLIQETIWET